MNSTSVRPLRNPGRGKPGKAQATSAAVPVTGVQVTPVRSTLELEADELVQLLSLIHI